MVKKSIPLSLRIADDDAAFLARYEAEGAATPSEKVRHLLAEARVRNDAKEPEDGRTAALHDLAAGRTRWRQHEEAADRYSDLILKAYDRAPDLFGLLMIGPKDETDLVHFERSLAREIARLLEDVLTLHLAGHDRSYGSEELKRELGRALRLAKKLEDAE